MNLSKIKLPSNKKFGYFFTLIFAIVSIFFFYSSIFGWSILFAFAGVIFFVITLIKEDLLLPLNKLWMCFGLLLGKIISPLVLGVIFFFIFTPIAFLMRLRKRDELHLKFKDKASYWILRSEKKESFKNQF